MGELEKKDKAGNWKEESPSTFPKGHEIMKHTLAFWRTNNIENGGNDCAVDMNIEAIRLQFLWDFYGDQYTYFEMFLDSCKDLDTFVKRIFKKRVFRKLDTRSFTDPNSLRNAICEVMERILTKDILARSIKSMESLLHKWTQDDFPSPKKTYTLGELNDLIGDILEAKS